MRWLLYHFDTEIESSQSTTYAISALPVILTKSQTTPSYVYSYKVLQLRWALFRSATRKFIKRWDKNIFGQKHIRNNKTIKIILRGKTFARRGDLPNYGPDNETWAYESEDFARWLYLATLSREFSQESGNIVSNGILFFQVNLFLQRFVQWLWIDARCNFT